MIEKDKVQRGAQVMPATVNRKLDLLKHMLTKAAVRRSLKSNPTKPLKLLKEESRGAYHPNQRCAV